MTQKICLVTGGNSGIGREIALGLARSGATVIVIDRVEANDLIAAATAENLQKNLDIYVADMSDQQSIRAVAKTISERYQHIDVLINNAGRHLIERETSVDGLEMNFALNCVGGFLLTELLLESLKAAVAGRIINMASEAHRVPGRFDLDDLNTEHAPMTYAYGKSKFGVILWTKAMADELTGSSVTVNCVCPGLVATKIFANFVPRWLMPVTVAMSKLGLMSSPAQGAKVPLRLALNDAYANSTGRFFGSHVITRHFNEHKGTNNKILQRELLKVMRQITRTPT